MFNPVATYRIQFHKDFTFAHLEAIIPYLQQLGISTLYASPVFTALPGSTHGYDCTNPLEINPEIGTLDELKTLSQKLQAAGISWVQDIVPNHMAFHTQNGWLVDVLAKGEESEYAPVFDIDWNQPGNRQLMVPFLGKTFADAVADGDIKLTEKEGQFYLSNGDDLYPLSAASVQEHQLAEKGNAFDDAAFILQVAKSQYYRLCHWQETDDRINYRRFFTVNALICLNMQNENVFTLHHQLVLQLVKEGVFHGLRIDHIDGLQNPTEYINRLRAAAGADTYIIAEKILEMNEGLPTAWNMQGSTGYDFLAQVNNLLTNSEAQEPFTSFYQHLTGNADSIHHQLHQKKSHILYTHMNGELENLYRLFKGLNLIDKRRLSVIPSDDLKSALGEFLIQCPVYRFYGEHFPLNDDEASKVRHTLNAVRRSGEDALAVGILEEVFLMVPYNTTQEINERIAGFYKRCMQFTGPLMAKGLEDTLMYTYNRFIGHNEVGDSPEAFGKTSTAFHAAMQARQLQWPLTMNATATHDTKRGEDARARLNVLTDLHTDWLAKVEEWRELNADAVGDVDANDEYLVYQALVAHYEASTVAEAESSFSERLEAYLQKALREAKTASNWAEPNEAYEGAVKRFAVGLLQQNTPFWKSFTEWQQRIADHAVINSLSQTLLKACLPGMPDTYQGTELWDYSFVDPDNRRPVDYELRSKALEEFDQRKGGLLKDLWEKKQDGRIKLWLTQKLLHLRRAEATLFAEGDYLPLQTEGKYKDNVFAFARRQGDRVYVFAVPLHTASLCAEQGINFFGLDWADTAITLPEHAGVFEHLLQRGEGDKVKRLDVQQLFKRFPLAALKGKQATKGRGAGVLLHITSLPSAYGIGDLGRDARRFADFLHRSGQQYWQLLPLNPTDEGQGWSPYSATSSKAGWPLLLSLEPMVKLGWLTAEDVASLEAPSESKVDYRKVHDAKTSLLSKAFDKYSASAQDQSAFESFMQKEKQWLDDFALYQYLKNEHDCKPWYEWPDDLKHRDEEALDAATEDGEAELRRIKWCQWQFSLQWTSLKTYCNNRNIRFIGDIPFYVAYDSADVWSAQHLFSLDDDGSQLCMAGVPPDAFSDDGQLWGMPTFNWHRIEEEGWLWWIQRLRKNMELFDLTRLDHFRAFADYWEVPAGEKTARKGQWVKGPGEAFFKAIQKEFGSLPFVAEDLGHIDEAVLSLRDEYNLPGMNVLQFAFGSDMPQSGYIPHNYEKNSLVYTGTHDNNTTTGWWRKEANEAMRKRVSNYVGKPVDEENVHRAMIRLAYASVSNIAIIPAQDILGLDERDRMNTPSSGTNNWAWRLLPGQLSGDVEKELKTLVETYDR